MTLNDYLIEIVIPMMDENGTIYDIETDTTIFVRNEYRSKLNKEFLLLTLKCEDSIRIIHNSNELYYINYYTESVDSYHKFMNFTRFYNFIENYKRRFKINEFLKDGN